MTRTCGACRSTRREDLDASLRAGMTLVSVARLSGVPVSVLKRHRAAGHVVGGVGAAPTVAPSYQPPQPAIHESEQAVGTASPGPASEIDDLIRVLDGMMAGATVSQRIDIIAERRRNIETRNRIVGPPPPEVVRLTDIPEYVEVEQVMFDVLEAHPDVRRELADALRALRYRQHAAVAEERGG